MTLELENVGHTLSVPFLYIICDFSFVNSPPFLPLWFLELILVPPLPVVPCFILDHVLLLGHLPVISVPYN